MTRTSLAVVSAFLFAASSAQAADMAVKAPPSVTPVNSWTGFYAGLNVGGIWGSSGSLLITPNDPTTAAEYPCFTPGNPGGVCPPPSGEIKQTGLMGGGQIGYNWQFSNVVTGIETDIQDDAGRRSSLVTQSLPISNVITQTYNQRLDWFGTVRGRLGVLVMPNILAYATAGYAYGNINSQYSLVSSGTFVFASTASANTLSSGGTVGAGLEFAVAQQVTLGVEYLYIDLAGPSGMVAHTSGAASPACTTANCNFSITSGNLSEHIARAKLNVRF